MSKTIAVYGSLKKGYYNHDRFLKDEQQFGDVTIKGTMYSLGSYPALVREGDDVHDVELYEIEDDVYSRIEMMEISAGYDAVPVDFDGVTAIVFYASKEMAEILKDNYKVISKY